MSQVFMFISGFAGTGKTTLLHTLAQQFPQYAYQDLDDLYRETSCHVLPEAKVCMQQTIDACVARHTKPLILGGVNFLGNDLQAEHYIVLNTSSLRVAWRLWHRATVY